MTGLRTDNFQGENWEIISPDLTTNDPEHKDTGPIPYCTITTLDESPVRQGVIWVGTADGGLNRWDPQLETFTSYANDPDDPAECS